MRALRHIKGAWRDKQCSIDSTTASNPWRRDNYCRLVDNKSKPGNFLGLSFLHFIAPRCLSRKDKFSNRLWKISLAGVEDLRQA
ncbi:hypothetical protein Nepgr_022390 [Nepenthes gracilis]|uniref:Uncharacterized protein n=1 Tax=Nepenthes gracilis TaxID=150966 RepID=A0AAD3XY13_NEPGR|nr:hypothetical protein Nepgr_022390 [Nepenthes gracilis]